MISSSTTFNTGLLLLRVISGFMMIFGHGWGKLMNLIKGNWGFADIMGLPPSVSLILAVIIEVGVAALLMVGFRTKWMALLLFLVMAAALIFYHTADPLFIAHANGGGSKELAIMYGVVFLSLALMGAGKYSIKGR